MFCFRCLLLSLFVFGPLGGAAQAQSSREFFENIRALCGNRFQGRTEFPTNADHPMVGKSLEMFVSSCADAEIRIPFKVGDDKSRTWVLRLTGSGVLLKHDHRHADGTPDKVTNYGGWANPDGTADRLSFAADEETAKLIPEASTNVWTLEFDSGKKWFSYTLHRNNELRYRAVFDLQKPAK